MNSKSILVIFGLSFLVASCSSDNYRVFGGINEEMKNKNQIVLSYMTDYELVNVLENSTDIAQKHCVSHKKNASLASKTEGKVFTTLAFDCK